MEQENEQKFPIDNAYFHLAFYWFSWIISNFGIIGIIFYCCNLVFFFVFLSFAFPMGSHISHPHHRAQTRYDNSAQKNTITVSLTNLTVTLYRNVESYTVQTYNKYNIFHI